MDAGSRRRAAGCVAAVLLTAWPTAAIAAAPEPSGNGIGVSVTVEQSSVDDNGLLPDTGGPTVWLILAAAGGIATGLVLLTRARRQPH